MPQVLQWRWHVQKGCAIAQCSGLTLKQRNIVLPVVTRLTAFVQSVVIGHRFVPSDNHQPLRI